jgi:hypothetical protein
MPWFFLFACNDYDLHESPNDDGTEDDGPAIEVTPAHITFPSLNVLDGETAEETITIRNVGNETLDIVKVWLVGDPASYTLSNLGVAALEPDETTTIVATFHPPHTLGATSTVEIQSNDPHRPLSEVFLDGDGLAPDLVVSPSPLDMGLVLPGCVTEQDITLENVGDAPLTVTDLAFSAGSDDITWEPVTKALDTLPWVLAAGEAVVTRVHYAPLVEGEDLGQLQVTSNDPAEPVTGTSITALAGIGDVEDIFEQPLDPSSDLLFVIDDSSSMDDSQNALATNGSRFIDALETSTVDWHIGVITTTQSVLRGPVLTHETANVEAAFTDQIVAGTDGAHHEKGIEKAYYALQEGGNAGPGSAFFRDTARLVIVFVSDEQEQSTDIEPDQAADYFLDLKDAGGGVVAHSIIALPEDNCAVDTYGTRYADVTDLVGGSRLSICGDWSAAVDDVAASASFALDRFGLSEIPRVDSIVVTVDGVLALDWTYDEVDNEVVFAASAIPPGGSIIDIQYEIGGCGG